MQSKAIQSEWSCAKCGACSTVCPVFKEDNRESLTARGRLHLLNTASDSRPSAVFEDLFSRCLLCTACEQVCPRKLPITQIVAQARNDFSLLYGPKGLRKAIVRSVLSRPALMEGLVKAGISLRRITALPDDSGLRLKLALLEDRPAAENGSAPEPPIHRARTNFSYFTGCFARHLQPSIAKATKKLLARCGYAAHSPDAQHCCGLAAWSAGNSDQARALARKNIQAFSALEGPIITSCASCSSHLLTYPSLFAENDPWHHRAQNFAERIQEFNNFFNKNLSIPEYNGSTSSRIFYHDPCHLRFKKAGKEAPRSLLTRAGFTLLEPEQGPLCCGQGGLFHLVCPEISESIFQKSGNQALAGFPDCITSTCSGCLMQYHQGVAEKKPRVKVIHLALLLQQLWDESNRRS